MKNLFIASTAAVVAVGASVLPVSAAEGTFFTDVNKSHVLYPEIADLHGQGKIDGYLDGTFRQHEVVTRGQAAKMIAAILELDTTSPKAPNLKDVSKDKWYYGSIAALVEHKIMGGFKDGTFRPDQTLTRAEASRLISEAFSLTAEGLDIEYTDVKKGTWYYTYVQALVTNKVTVGKSPGSFAPGDPVTRGELVAFASRAMKALGEPAAPPQVNPGDGNVTPPPTNPGGGGTGGTDESTEPLEASMHIVEDQFGFVTLDIKNQGSAKIRYQLIPSRDFVLPKKGDQVPAESLEYNGDPFIYWPDHEVVVYKVDSSNRILDVVKAPGMYPDYYNVQVHDNGTATVTILGETMGLSVDSFMHYLYIYQDNVKKKLIDFKNASWNKGTALPSFTIPLDGVDMDKPGFVLIGARLMYTDIQLNNDYPSEEVKIQLVHDLAKETISELADWSFPSFLGHFAYDYELHKSLLEQDSLSMKAYREQLIQQEANLQTGEAIKEMILSVNRELKDKVDVLHVANDKLNAMYRADFYNYDDRFRNDLTQEEVDDARNAVNAVSDEFTEKSWLISLVDEAESFLYSKEITDYISSLNLTVPKGLLAGADISNLLNSEGKPEKLKLVPYKTGQTFDGEYVSGGSSYLKVVNEKLVLTRPNQTGTDKIEYVELKLFYGSSFLEYIVLPITLTSSEYNEGSLSGETKVQINWSERTISSIDERNKTIFAYRGTTVEELKKGLVASDYSVQTYVVKNASKIEKTTGEIENGDIISVTAENGKKTDDYLLQETINMTDLQEEALGSFSFNAEDTTADELERVLSIQNSNSTATYDVTVTAVEGSVNSYVASFNSAKKDEIYKITAKTDQSISFEPLYYLIWRSYSIHDFGTSPLRHDAFLREDSIEIESADKINITFNDAESYTVDGVTISPTVAEKSNGLFKITFTSTGTDAGNDSRRRIIDVKVEVDGIENNQILLALQSDGSYQVNVSH